jgi:16S rRNA (cytidine1402-2'-O)-methyltransferase
MLYVVGTPLGNLEDLSIRQARTLCESDIILTEDTRSTGILFQKIEEYFSFKRNPQQRLISYYREKEFEKLPDIMDLLEEEKQIALISQAGLPLISDPGSLLIKTLIKKQIPFTVIPGPTAVMMGVLYSGFNTGEFYFGGFLAKRTSEIVKVITQIKEIKKIIKDVTMVYYESPQRIDATLKILAEHVPESNVAICREMTKKFEEIVRGKPADLLGKTWKGEITLVLQLP